MEPGSVLYGFLSIGYDALFVKGYSRLLVSLLEINEFNCGESLLVSALKAYPKLREFKGLLEQFKIDAKKQKEAPKIFTQRDMKEEKNNDLFGAMNSFLTMLPASENVFVKIPAFHTEYTREGYFPAESDRGRAMTFLREAYDYAKSVRYITMKEMTMVHDVEEDDLRKRLNYLMIPSFINWYNSSSIGSVTSLNISVGYATGCVINHSFGNAPYKSLPFEFGKKHVAFGFVDLGLLAVGKFIGLFDGVPFEFYGYEMSSYSVAKSLVIKQMLIEGCAVDSILQVWFSSVWSSKTEAQFKLCIQHLLKEGKMSKETRNWIESWSASSISLSVARSEWMDNVGRTAICIANILEYKDRIALINYLITGQLLQGEMGSVVMFSDKQRVGLAMDENFLQCIDMDHLHEYRKKNATFIDAGIQFFRHGIEKLQKLMAKNQVIVHLVQQVIFHYFALL